MIDASLSDRLERSPVIAAVRDDVWQQALDSPVEILFYLKANLLTVGRRVAEAVEAGKIVFVHIDLVEGIGKDKVGIAFLAHCGVHGIISTRSQLIHLAKEQGLLTVQRCFALDSQGLACVKDILSNDGADLLEIMPGVIPKAIDRFASGSIPVIAGGLIETKAEVMAALQSGAIAVSSGKEELWYL